MIFPEDTSGPHDGSWIKPAEYALTLPEHPLFKLDTPYPLADFMEQLQAIIAHFEDHEEKFYASADLLKQLYSLRTSLRKLFLILEPHQLAEQSILFTFNENTELFTLKFIDNTLR